MRIFVNGAVVPKQLIQEESRRLAKISAGRVSAILRRAPGRCAKPRSSRRSTACCSNTPLRDRAKIKAPIRELGLGELKFLDADGNPL